MHDEVPLPRLYVLRCMYLLNAALVGGGVCAAFVQRTAPWEPVQGVAFSFWAALACLSALGIRYPLAMLPVLLLQLLYKALWMAAVYAPLQAIGRSTGLTTSMVVGIILDVLVIPWGHVIRHYVSSPGDRWSIRRSLLQESLP